MSTNFSVELVRIGALAPTVLPALREDLARVVAHPIWIAADQVDPTPAFDPGRRQYLASTLMAILLERERPDGVMTIGLTAVDVFLPVFTHVFGSAQLGGPTAIVSLFRLRPECAGDPPDAGLLRIRLLKEVLHELGHILGLVHCPSPWCVMHASRLPEQIDLKDAALCRPCAETVGVPPISR